MRTYENRRRSIQEKRRTIRSQIQKRHQLRKKYAEFLWEKNFILPKIISPEAIVSDEAQIGEGCAVLPGAVIEEAEIGNFCIIDPKVKVGKGETVKEYTHLTKSGRRNI